MLPFLRSECNMIHMVWLVTGWFLLHFIIVPWIKCTKLRISTIVPSAEYIFSFCAVSISIKMSSKKRRVSNYTYNLLLIKSWCLMPSSIWYYVFSDSLMSCIYLLIFFKGILDEGDIPKHIVNAVMNNDLDL